MMFPIPWSIPSQSTIRNQNTSKHWCQHIKPMLPRHTRAHRPKPKIYLPYFTTRISSEKQTYPGNQFWVLLNMSRSHIKTNYKVSPRVINYYQSSPRPTKTMVSCNRCFKCHTCSNQGKVENKWGTLRDIWPKWK